MLEFRPGKPAPTFMHAEWRDLAMASFAVKPELLQPLVPAGTELDTWHGKPYVSVVGYANRTRSAAGLPVPVLDRFDGLNLRFYVKRKTADGWHRGAVFVRELVPSKLLAGIGRTLFGEPFAATPVSHEHAPDGLTYRWGKASGDAASGTLHVVAAPGAPREMAEGSLEAFIADRAWGFRRQEDGSTTEFAVDHEPWKYRPAAEARFEGTIPGGGAVGAALPAVPDSAMVVEGSAVDVHFGQRLD